MKTGIDLMSLIGIRSEADKEITCSSPLTVRFIFYALNPSVLIVFVTAVTKYMSCIYRPPNLVKVDNITRPLSKLGRAVFEQLFDDFFFVISRKITILDITSIESKHTEHILSD